MAAAAIVESDHRIEILRNPAQSNEKGTGRAIWKQNGVGTHFKILSHVFVNIDIQQTNIQTKKKKITFEQIKLKSNYTYTSEQLLP